MRDTLLVINAGSSSIKFALFAQRGQVRTCKGMIEGIGSSPRFFAKTNDGATLDEQHFLPQADQAELLEFLLDWIVRRFGAESLLAVGHRIVHGGPHYYAPVFVTEQVLQDLRDTVPLAPLHQPHNLAPIVALRERHPELAQVACFDTAFHASNSRISRLYALPRALSDAGIWRYGFHGLSYEYIADALPRYDANAARGRTVVAHLGSGASLCALRSGVSVASSMGFSALDGVPMGTRCGAIDPGVLLYLLRDKNYGIEQLTDLLYRESGLLGLSGIASDMRTLLASNEAGAREAVDVFVYRCAREVGSLLAAAEGLDALVFTAGIGERAAPVRSMICAQLAWLGVRLDEAANARDDTRISTANSAVSVWVIPTDEEKTIARHTAALLAAEGG